MAVNESGVWHMALNGSMCKVTVSPSFLGICLLLKLKPFFILLYVVLVLVACGGNLLLLAHIISTKKLHTTTNFLIGNLAASDLVMCIFCVPMTASYAFASQGWLFGIFMCYFMRLMQSTTVFVSVLSLTAIAVDRYVVVVYPVHRRIRPRSCAYVIVLIWLVSISISLPTPLHTQYININQLGFNMIICEELWYKLERQGLLYSCMVFLLFYMLPVGAVSISYCAITCHLKRRKVPGAELYSHDKWSKKKRRTFYMLLISVLSFALCWMPLQTVNLIWDIDQSIIDNTYVEVIQVSCHLVAMSSACYNPFIYASLHDKFRLHLSNLLTRNKKQGSSTMSTQTSRLNTCTSLDVPTVTDSKLKRPFHLKQSA
ncbi:prolactin releasing hormone 2 receptor [Rhinoraja longicauda]